MADEQHSIAIPLVEERVTVGKRVVETGSVRVRTLVEELRLVTERLEMPVTLRAQRAVVEREESSGEPQKQE